MQHMQADALFLISDQRWKALSLAQCKVANHSVSVGLQAGAADADEVQLSSKKYVLKMSLLKVNWSQLKVNWDQLKSIESKLKSIESNLKSIESKLKVFWNQLKVNWNQLKSIESKLKSIESKLKSIESKLKSIDYQLKSIENQFKVKWNQLKSIFFDFTLFRPGQLKISTLKRFKELFRGGVPPTLIRIIH